MEWPQNLLPLLYLNEKINQDIGEIVVVNPYPSIQSESQEKNYSSKSPNLDHNNQKIPHASQDYPDDPFEILYLRNLLKNNDLQTQCTLARISNIRNHLKYQ